jgi:F0F1-type ATP synthase assembly protein I
METDVRQSMNAAVRLTLVVLGVGLLTSLIAGLMLGAVIGDLAEGIGTAVAVGMSVTAVLGVALNLLWREPTAGASRDGPAGGGSP